MARWKKTVAKILTQTHYENLDFADLKGALKGVGYTFKGQEGSHEVYKQDGWEQMNIQPKKGKAKDYQVRQF